MRDEGEQPEGFALMVFQPPVQFRWVFSFSSLCLYRLKSHGAKEKVKGVPKWGWAARCYRGHSTGGRGAFPTAKHWLHWAVGEKLGAWKQLQIDMSHPVHFCLNPHFPYPFWKKYLMVEINFVISTCIFYAERFWKIVLFPVTFLIWQNKMNLLHKIAN